MVSIGISEFTFGFAFLYEQAHSHWNDLKAAPVLPSLQQEQAQGWDAHLPKNGTDFYYQFKLSEYLSRANAKYRVDLTYFAPYYRIALHRKNRNLQHQRLRDHVVDHPHTFYAAPAFKELETFNSSFLSHQITAKSKLIAVSDCNDVYDDQQHYITFQEGVDGFNFHSDSTHREKGYSGTNLGAIYENTRNEWRHVDRKFAEAVLEKARDSVKRSRQREEVIAVQQAVPLLDAPTQNLSQRELFERSSEVLSTFFGLTLVLVGTEE